MLALWTTLTRQWTTGRMLTGAPAHAQDYEATRRAAEQGDAQAQYELGVMYANGQGVPQDYISAHMWLNLAAASGHEDARGLRDEVAEAQARAREWSNR